MMPGSTSMAAKILKLFKYLTYIPWQTSMTVQPIEQLLNAPTARQDDLTEVWKEAKLSELAFVGLAVR